MYYLIQRLLSERIKILLAQRILRLSDECDFCEVLEHGLLEGRMRHAACADVGDFTLCLFGKQVDLTLLAATAIEQSSTCRSYYSALAHSLFVVSFGYCVPESLGVIPSPENVAFGAKVNSRGTCPFG